MSDPKGVLKVTGAIPQTIRKVLRKKDGTPYSIAFVSQVIRGDKHQAKIEDLQLRMLKIKERRNIKILSAYELMRKIDQEYLDKLLIVAEKHK